VLGIRGRRYVVQGTGARSSGTLQVQKNGISSKAR